MPQMKSLTFNENYIHLYNGLRFTEGCDIRFSKKCIYILCCKMLNKLLWQLLQLLLNCNIIHKYSVLNVISHVLDKIIKTYFLKK